MCAGPRSGPGSIESNNLQCKLIFDLDSCMFQELWTERMISECHEKGDTYYLPRPIGTATFTSLKPTLHTSGILDCHFLLPNFMVVYIIFQHQACTHIVAFLRVIVLRVRVLLICFILMYGDQVKYYIGLGFGIFFSLSMIFYSYLHFLFWMIG